MEENSNTNSTTDTIIQTINTIFENLLVWKKLSYPGRILVPQGRKRLPAAPVPSGRACRPHLPGACAPKVPGAGCPPVFSLSLCGTGPEAGR